jgi:solute carrier family 7 (L-type amino acid transporter), member 8
VAVACNPYLRWKRPEMVRPIRVNLLFPIIYILATLFIIVVSTIASYTETLYGCLLMLTAVPVYFVFIYWRNKPECIHDCLVKVTLAMQKLLVIIQPEESKHQ